jgi:shikimate dehydrogenase
VKLALIGDPVAHSRSPRLHRGFLEEAGIDGDYVSIRVPRDNAIDVLRRMRLDGYTGCNVTYPLKEEALRACDVVDEEARRIGAVNTILFGMEIRGANTDGIGARSALEAILEEPLALKRVGVLGTGATARAILSALQECDAYAFVWGRDDEKVADLRARFECDAWPADNPPEITINTLPPEVALPSGLIEQLQTTDFVMDANYGDRATLAKQLRREVIPGDAMLEAQARASFDYWLAHVERVGN